MGNTSADDGLEEGQGPGGPGIAASIVGGVVRALAELGYDATTRTPEDATAIIDGTIADRMLDRAAVALDDPAVGISTARRIPIGSLGDLDYALVTSVTLREGMDRLVRFYGVVTQRVTLSLVETDTRARLVFVRRPDSTHSPHWAEFASAIIPARIRKTVGREVSFDEVSFAHPAPSRPTIHDTFFGTKVLFGSSVDALGFDRTLLASPLRTAAAALGEVLEARLRDIAQVVSSPPYVDRVRLVVAQLLSEEGKTQLDETAARLRTSTRTLQRELREHGTSHQQIVDEVRRDRAQAMLESGGTLAEVSSRPGFAEPSAFFRAFRRWTGLSPGAAARRGK